MLCGHRAADGYGRNRRSKLRSVSSPIAPAVTPRTAASCSTTFATYAGSLRLPRNGIGARYGLSVSTSSRSAGARGGGLAQRFGLWKGRDAGNREEESGRERASAAAWIAGEAVKHAAQTALPFLADDAQRVVFGFAGVNHDRQVAARAPAGSARETPRAARRAARSRSDSRGRSRRSRAPPAARRAAPATVSGGRLRIRGEHVGVMGMNADSEPALGPGLRARSPPARSPRRLRRRESRARARRPPPARVDDRVKIGDELLAGNMAMTIGQGAYGATAPVTWN